MVCNHSVELACRVKYYVFAKPDSCLFVMISCGKNLKLGSLP